MGAPTWIDVLEATYDVDAGEEQWLQGIARASDRVLDAGFGIFAFVYDASVPERMTIERFVRTRETLFDAQRALAGIEAAGGGRYVRHTFRTLKAGAVRSTPEFAGSEAERMLDADGVGDFVVINGLDPSGIGMCVGTITARRARLSRPQRLRYERIAAHLANGYRLRRRLASPITRKQRAPWGADAVLSTRGSLEHCGADDVYRARGQLRAGTAAIERARGRSRRIPLDSALADWLGLVDGRWSLVDKFDSDGKRYVLARRNEPRVAGLGLLTERERAIAAYAALGHDNKLIAYELGIAHSTVRVLIARAAKRLGVKTRDGLVEAVRAASVAAPGRPR